MTKESFVLGVSMSNHDRSACLLADGVVIGAIAEERLDRRKRSEGFFVRDPRGAVVPPTRAITRLLRDAGLNLDSLDLVVCGRSITSAREDFLNHVPIDADRVCEPALPSHHLAHAYSAYASSPHDSTAVLVIDEQGHWVDGRFERASWYRGSGGPLAEVGKFWGNPDDLSLGMFYNVFAGLTGLAEAGRPAAGKLMSLAGFGVKRPEWRPLIDLHSSGDAGCGLNALDEFLSNSGVNTYPGMTGLPVKDIDDLLSKYRPTGWRNQLAFDLARKAQDELESAVHHVSRALHDETGAQHLAYAGGVALNCSANAGLSTTAGWHDVHVHPAATDDGAALGLAFYGWIDVLGKPRKARSRFSPMTGPRHDSQDETEAIARYGLLDSVQADDDLSSVASLIADGAVVCWFHGRSEWGPRALGARSIVADPQRPNVTEEINAKVKYRESFRPFGISLSVENASDFIELGSSPVGLRPYMLSVGAAIHPGLKSIAHVDGTVRYQLVERELEPQWHALIERVGAATGLPALLNTSFNTIGEPLVESPDDAVRQFLVSDADALWMSGKLIVANSVAPAVYEAARLLAWDASHLDPLHVALGFESSGHPGAAKRVLTWHGVTDDDVMRRGEDTLRLFHMLKLRIALAEGRSADGQIHARAALNAYHLPNDVLSAAHHLATNGETGTEAIVGQLLSKIGVDSSLFTFMMTLLEGAESEVETL